MRRRLATVIVVLLASILGVLAWYAYASAREPVLEGRALSSWLDHHVASTAANPPYNSPGWKKADEALRQVGTNAIPTLLKMVRAKEKPHFFIKLFETARRRGWTQKNYRYASALHEEAEYAFRMLGTNGSGAVPELIRIYEQNISPASQRCAALSLADIGPPAQIAVPVFIRDFTHTNSEVRFYAVSAVYYIGGEPKVIIPAMVNALKDTNINVRWNALLALSNFGSRARSVVPEIVKMLSDDGKVGDSPIREQVETALWRIAPEKIGRPIVVETPTPIITNGVTAAALKLTFDGERKILIAPGKPIPVVAQYWSSDPRPYLTLYRGGTNSFGEKDALLGKFEMMDLPSSPDLNISTLCIIADGQIILNARDNTRQRFLEIRRIENEPLKRPEK